MHHASIGKGLLNIRYDIVLTNFAIVLSVAAIFMIAIWVVRNDKTSRIDDQSGIFAMKKLSSAENGKGGRTSRTGSNKR